MKKKINAKRIGAMMLAFAMATAACTPAIASFTQAQPVANKKAKSKAKVKKSKTKKKKSYRAKAGTVNLKAITLTKGKSKTISVKSKNKVTWKTSNKSVVSVKSISKSKVKITAKKAGSANVTGKAKSAKWNVKVKVKGWKPTPTPSGTSSKKSKKNTKEANNKLDIVFCGHYYAGALENNDTIKYNGTNDSEFISVSSKNYKKIKFTSLNPDTIKIGSIDYISPTSRYTNIPGKGTVNCDVIPLKTGKATIKVSSPSGERYFYINIKEDPLYTAVKGFVEKVNSSNLDDAHKAFVVAKWLEHRAEYKNVAWGGYANLIYGKGGTCEAYAGAYHYLCELTGITVDEAATENHIWNQIKINGKWYNVDTTNDDSCNDDPLSNEVEFFDTEYFMKSDNYRTDSDWQPFNDKDHLITDRGDGKNPTAADYDNYDWKPFLQSEQFKALIS